MQVTKAEIIREYGPFPGNANVGGVTCDGKVVWWASEGRISALDPASGEILRHLEVPAQAGTAFDGRHLYQTYQGSIRKIVPETGEIVATIPAPSAGGCSGLAWAEGSLWVGEADARKIHQLDPLTGAVIRTIVSDRVVTGVTWVDGELWHGTWEDESDLRRIDPDSGEVLETIAMPDGTGVSGLESDGGDRFYCGGGSSGKIRIVRRPKRAAAAAAGNS
jgi:streptogramin lyase